MAKYDELADVYDSRWRGYLESTHERGLELLAPQSGDVILDAAAGTGLFASRVARKLGDDGELHLVDKSAEMLEAARERFDDDASVHIQQADIHALPYDDETFDRVACLSSFHYFREPRRVLDEFRRILKPGGVLALVDWSNDRLHFRLYDWALRLFSGPHHRCYTADELAELLNASRFEVDERIGWIYRLWSLMGLRAFKR